ncbi:hypothetical protein P691DRAFT_255761 [Macrolepiota fuliginosa MF-IS2]|uniref:Secreted protein n=1 Tax=Macrolepiota fuliginosa MF-IS2 TaxID=1400762 RepID=A0A9P5WXP5_9AGAR|nr:hypothetical protein P691DRAFT_255761 [Macrolepiota fuliginosa MF-IS2]
MPSLRVAGWTVSLFHLCLIGWLSLSLVLSSECYCRPCRHLEQHIVARGQLHAYQLFHQSPASSGLTVAYMRRDSMLPCGGREPALNLCL